MDNFIAKASMQIDGGKAAVWDALTDPEKIKQYLFGTETITDWKEGSRITYKGQWEGKEYEDGGTILKIEPEKILQTTYWSSMSGTPDIPENYCVVTYELSPADKGTVVTITQDKCKTEGVKQHMEQNWTKVLEGLKKVVEEDR